MPTTSPIKVPIIGKDELSKKLDTINRRVKNFKAKTDKIGGVLTRRLTLPLMLAGGASLKFAKDFNKGMAEISTLLPNQREKVEKYKKSVLDLAVKTGTANEEVTKGLYGVISAYGDSADSVKKLDIVMKTAKAGVTGGAEALDLLSGVTLAYGEKTAEAVQKAADLSFTAMRLGKTTLPLLSEAILKITPYASEFNVTQEKLFGTMAHLSGVTGSTSEAATQLASVYGNLLKPTELLKKSVRDLGFESAVAMGKALDMDQLFKAIKVMSVGKKKIDIIAKGLGYSSYKAMVAHEGEAKALETVAEKVELNADKLGQLVTRKEGQRAVLNVVGAGQERYKEILDETAKSTDALSRAYKDYTEGVGKSAHKWDQTVEKFKRSAIIIGDRLLPVLERLFDKISPWLKKLEDMDDATLDFYLKLAGIALVAGPAIRTIGSLTSAFFNLGGPLVKATKGIYKTATAVETLGLNASGMLTSNMSRMNKFLRLLSKGGLVLGAGAIGYGAGTLISKIFLEPAAAEKAKMLADIAKRREEAELKVLRVGTAKEKVEAAKVIGEDIKKLPEAATKSKWDWFIGTVASVFTDVKSPMEQLMQEAKESKEVQKKLLASAQEDLKKRKDTKIEVVVKNESGVTAEVKTTGKPAAKVLPNKGLVMDATQ